MDNFPFQTTTDKWASLARAFNDEHVATEFDAYAGTGRVSDGGLLKAIDEISKVPMARLAGAAGELRDFRRHVVAVMNRKQLPEMGT